MEFTEEELDRVVLDGMVLWSSENDPAMDYAVKWLDEQAQKKGISFYDIVGELTGRKKG